jgi:energy-coupling factor transporter ATP-binding protein EcfA2/ABC-type multidrug transport system permease subunit
METQTVREAFMFSAQTRLGLCKDCKEEITEDDQHKMVDYTLDMLDLKQSADIQIADLDSQEKKRCTMGVELASDPAILFLDEPTSGLDSVGALTVMDCIEKIKKSGVTVICTIHQPAESLFEYFDMLLLLKKGGYQVYFGPCPKRSTDQSFKSLPLDFFRGLKDAPEWKFNNPADYILDFCDAGKDFDKQYQGHSTGIKLRNMIQGSRSETPSGQSMKAHSYYEKNPKKPEYEHEYAIQGTWAQTKILLSRSAADFWRSPDYNAVRMLVALFTGLLIGLMFLRLDDTMSGCQNKIAALFLGVLIQVTSMLQAANPIFNQRAVHFRERKSMCYKEHAYFITIGTVEVPYLLISVNIFVWIVFFMVHLNTDSGRVLYFWLFFVTYQVYNISLGQFLAAVAPTKAVASAMGPALSTLFSLTAGFMIVPSQIPNYWKWLYWVSPTHYALEGLCANELQGTMCGTSTGESVLDSLDMDYDNRWRNYFIVLGYALALRIATLYVLKHVEHVKR